MSLRSLVRLPIPLLALLSVTRLVEGECYVAAYGLIGKQSDWSACPGTSTSPGGAQSCCIPGSECGEDSICHVPNSSDGNAWYVAGCTDPNFDDPVCNNVCVGYATTFIQYQNSAGSWMCCGDGGCNGTVTDDTFAGPSPQDWQVITGSSAPTSEAPATSPTSTTQTTSAEPTDPTSTDPAPTSNAPATSSAAGADATPSSSAAAVVGTTRTAAITSGDFKPSPIHRTVMTGTRAVASATSGADSSTSDSSSNNHSGDNDSSSGLSTGAMAGIGAAIGVAALALIVGLVAIYMLRKNRKSKSGERIPDEIHMKMDDISTSAPPYAPPQYAYSRSTVTELPTNPPVFEVDGAANEVRHKQWRPWQNF